MPDACRPPLTGAVYGPAKRAGGVIAAGDRVAWDDTAKQIVPPGTGMVPIGIATVAVGDDVATARVRLDGMTTEAA